MIQTKVQQPFHNIMLQARCGLKNRILRLYRKWEEKKDKFEKRKDKFEKNWKSLANPVLAPGLIWEWLYKLSRTTNVLQNVLEMYQKM